MMTIAMVVVVGAWLGLEVRYDYMKEMEKKRGSSVCRVFKNTAYAVMSNYHLMSTAISLKATGLLSKVLNLPDKWDYSVKGLASICKEK